MTERGLEWWKNGHPQSRNSGHLEPADCRFHGTMNGGQPGVGRVVFAGSLHLTL